MKKFKKLYIAFTILAISLILAGLMFLNRQKETIVIEDPETKLLLLERDMYYNIDQERAYIKATKFNENKYHFIQTKDFKVPDLCNKSGKSNDQKDFVNLDLTVELIPNSRLDDETFEQNKDVPYYYRYAHQEFLKEYSREIKPRKEVIANEGCGTVYTFLRLEEGVLVIDNKLIPPFYGGFDEDFVENFPKNSSEIYKELFEEKSMLTNQYVEMGYGQDSEINFNKRDEIQERLSIVGRKLQIEYREPIVKMIIDDLVITDKDETYYSGILIDSSYYFYI